MEVEVDRTLEGSTTLKSRPPRLAADEDKDDESTTPNDSLELELNALLLLLLLRLVDVFDEEMLAMPDEFEFGVLGVEVERAVVASMNRLARCVTLSSMERRASSLSFFN